MTAGTFRPYLATEWKEITPLEAARAVMGKALVVRKSDQSFNVGGVLGTVLGVGGVVVFWLWLLAGGSRHGVSKSDLVATELVKQGGQSMSLPTAGLHPPPTEQATYTPYLTYTALATFTMTPSRTAEATEVPYKLVTFLYSYYDPTLGGVNCANWDEESKTCNSLMSDGLDWRAYYDYAVACPLDYPLGTKVVFESPPILAHTWICMDYCPTCKEGWIIDFLQHNQVMPWLTVLSAKVYYP